MAQASRQSAFDQIECALSSHALRPSAPLLLLVVDDNMYYRSMRYEVHIPPCAKANAHAELLYRGVIGTHEPTKESPLVRTQPSREAKRDSPSIAPAGCVAGKDTQVENAKSA